MIPYDDLVAALATWRARQGLPVARGAVATPPPRAPAPAPAPARAAPAPAPARAVPQAAPPRARAPQLSTDLDDFGDDSALIEDPAYDAGGDDYVLPLGDAGVEPIGETTAIGGAPDRADVLLTPKRGKRSNDW